MNFFDRSRFLQEESHIRAADSRHRDAESHSVYFAFQMRKDHGTSLNCSGLGRDYGKCRRTGPPELTAIPGFVVQEILGSGKGMHRADQQIFYSEIFIDDFYHRSDAVRRARSI